MKKILLAIFFAAFLFSSCKKCGTCTTTITTAVSQPTPGYPKTTTITQDLCDDDLESADGKTATATVNQGNITATSTSVCHCITQ